MMTPSRRAVRSTALVVVLGGVLLLGNSALSAGTVAPGVTTPPNSSVPYGTHIPVEPQINTTDVDVKPIPPDAEVTVVATQGFFVSDENAELLAVTANGTVVYHNSTYRVYFDVDPVPDTRYTVEYVASRQLNGEDCARFETHWCTNNVVERVNLSTGEHTRVYELKTARVHSTRWHDVDRLNETHLVVADIHEDRVFVVDVRTGEITWQWRADEHYAATQGGSPEDWTHINDVEVLADGRIMVSVRNMDEVAFVEPGEGLQANWTLGTDDDRDVLYEQHNPDFIPAERGGPSVIVGDSENNRVIEYRRGDDGEWKRTWFWRDPVLQWPRDADRLPNGNTLIVDSHGDRVLEVSPNGSIAWSVGIGMPYDAERLGTGDESAGGDAIGRVRGAGDGGLVNAGPVEHVVVFLKDVLPSPWVNSLLYVGPAWFRFTDVLVSLLVLSTAVGWALLEFHWSRHSARDLAERAWERGAGGR